MLSYLLLIVATSVSSAQTGNVSAASFFSNTAFGAEDGGGSGYELGGEPVADYGNHSRFDQPWLVHLGAAMISRQNDTARLYDVDGMAGMKLMAMRKMPLADIEFAWLNLSSARMPESILLPAGTNVGIPLANDALSDVQFQSGLNSFELNARNPFGDRLAILAGLRYVNLDESARLSTLGLPNQATNGRSRLSNDLFGAQVGGFWSTGPIASGWSLEAVGKAGLYINAVSHDVRFTSLNPNLHERFRLHDNQAAFVADAELAAHWRMSGFFGLRFGYQFLLLDQVALLDNQTTLDVVNHSGLLVNSSPIFHGAFVQATMSW